MKYTTYIVAVVIIDRIRHFNIVACDMDAAHADLRATHGDDVEIVSTGIV